MSEQFPGNNPNTVISPEAHEPLALPTAEQAEPLRVGEKDPVLALAEARMDIAETAQADQQQAVNESLKAAEGAAPAPQQTISRDLESITLRRELNGLQRQESMPERTLSKLIHQPVVRKVSEAASGTVSRPSGILGGGVLAFIGTSSYLYLAKHMGFEYNFGVFILLFAGGFVLGIALEMLVHVATMSARARRNAS
jgi:hypothetical protein